MKRFTLTVAGQSLQFTEQDVPALDEALNAATDCEGREVVRHSASGARVSVTMNFAESGGLHSTLPRDSRTVLMSAHQGGPDYEQTDC